MPAAARKVPPDAPLGSEIAEPPYYEAAEDLYLDGDPGFKAQVAYRAGSRVSPAAVVRNGWGGKVRIPAKFRSVLLPSPPPPPPSSAVSAEGKE